MKTEASDLPQQRCRRRLEAIRIAESIAMRLRDIGTGLSTDRRTAEEYADMARTLRDIEDRLYRKGEYASENVART
jgi:hypothetical protein